jgi:hypothetical protein
MHHNGLKQNVGATDNSQASQNAMQAQQTAEYSEAMSVVCDELGFSHSLSVDLPNH